LEDTIVIGLAASRVARAISLDEVSAGWRERLVRSAEQLTGTGPRERVHRFVAGLVDCPVCTGWWASLATSVLWPGQYRVRRGLSVAGVQVLLTFAERLVSEQGRAVIERANEMASDGGGSQRREPR
jgi:hypothetical protein